jgi:putative ABC transport system permease protein
MSPLALARLVVQGLAAERRRAALAALGIAIGVASIVLLISIGAGAREYVKQQFGGIGSDIIIAMPGHVETTGAVPGMLIGTPRPLTIEDAREVKRRCRSVIGVAPAAIGSARVQAGSLARDCLVLGVTGEFENVRRYHPAYGRFLAMDGQVGRGDRVVCLGSLIARELFPNENPLGRTVKVGGTRFRVQAVMEPKGRQMGFDVDELVMIPQPVAMRIFNVKTLSRILIQIAAVEEEEVAEREVVRVIKARHHDIEDFTVLSPGTVLDSLRKVIDVLTGALAGIAAVSLIVGAIGIANVTLVSTTSRSAEIGLRKALGAAPLWILAQFLLEAGALGAFGGAAGATGAAVVVVATNWWFEGSLPLATPGWAVVLSVCACTLVGLIAGGGPAWRAAVLDPVAALRLGGGGRK